MVAVSIDIRSSMPDGQGNPAMGGRVLIGDDDPFVAAAAADALRIAGYDVVTAIGDEVLRVARECRPDVILLDLDMPGMGGAEVSRRLRAHPATARIPIVVMSAEQDLYTATSGLPIVDRLAKPVDLDRLYAAVARCAGDDE